MFFSSISSVIAIVLLIAVGYALKRFKWIGESFSKEVSKIVLNIALPASVFIAVLEDIKVNELQSLGIDILIPIGAVIVSYIIAFILMKIFRVRQERKGVFINAVVNTNSGFIGMPLTLAIFGEKSMPYYLLFFVVSMVSIWVIGVFVMAITNPSRDSNGKAISLKKLLTPPLIGMVLGIIFLVCGIHIPTFANSTLTYLGDLVSPLAMIYVGIVLCDAGLKNIRLDKDSVLSLVGRFIICPIIIIVILIMGTNMFGMNISSLIANTYIVQSATPMIAVLPILADQYNGDVKYATDITTISTVLFIIVIPVLIFMTQSMVF